ncbi:unnamed protein product [Urochloa humidicola]
MDFSIPDMITLHIQRVHRTRSDSVISQNKETEQRPTLQLCTGLCQFISYEYVLGS